MTETAVTTRPIWYFPDEQRFWMATEDAAYNAQVILNHDAAVRVTNVQDFPVHFIVALQQQSDAQA